MPGRIEGTVAIVSGAGSSGPGIGVGKATSILFAREGARVVLVDKFEDRATETLTQVNDAGGEGFVVVADITEPAACQRIVDEAVARYGTVDSLVNVAHFAPQLGLLDTSPDVYHQVMAVNVTAAFMLAKAAIPVMIQHGGGAIVNVTSVAALRGTGVSLTAYATSKAALVGMMNDIACAYGPQGIRVNSIAPGHVHTPMRDTGVAERGLDPATVDMGDRTALGFEGDGWDVARAALFLVSTDARYITAVHLPVDGGATARMP
jgi:NAD(P)-dependent dehydrogenase (short-subunit alcohol dehydrogenase family)